MPRWPNPELEKLESQPPAAPAPPPNIPVYDYQELNPEDAETRQYPYNGETVIVSDDPKYVGFAARWRSTRQLKGWKWVKTGKWETPTLNFPLQFDPLYWRKISKLEHL